MDNRSDNWADNWVDNWADNRADNRADNWADNRADNQADVNEMKFHQLHLFKREKKYANNQKTQNEKRRVITSQKENSDGHRIMRSPYMMAI